MMQIVGLYSLLILALCFVFVVLPGKRKHKKMQAMHKAIRPGDTIITMGGIVATVLEREEDTLVLQLLEDKECYMRVLTYAVQQIRPAAVEAETQPG